MADESHLEILERGVAVWNTWRKEHPTISPDLTGADLSKRDLRKINLSHAKLVMTKFSRADLAQARMTESNCALAEFYKADLTKASFLRAFPITANFIQADLSDANLAGANLSEAFFIRSNLVRANLCGANLTDANLTGADLTDANLERAVLVDTKITDAFFKSCTVYGISSWELKGTPKEASGLIYTRWGVLEERPPTVDNLEVAQFMYLLRENEKVREVLNAVTSKFVLILGRFDERKYVLEAIRDVLRQETNYLPFIFDFEPPEGRDILDTVKTLALLSKFILVDLTHPRSASYELDQIVSTMVPIQPLFQTPEKEPALLQALRTRHHWLLEPHYYNTIEKLGESLRRELISVAEAKATELKTQQK